MMMALFAVDMFLNPDCNGLLRFMIIKNDLWLIFEVEPSNTLEFYDVSIVLLKWRTDFR